MRISTLHKVTLMGKGGERRGSKKGRQMHTVGGGKNKSDDMVDLFLHVTLSYIHWANMMQFG